MTSTSISRSVAPGLAGLLGDVETSRFMSEYWMRQCLFLPRIDVECHELFAELAASSIRDLLRMGESVLVMHHTRTGEYRGTRVSASDAFAFYESNLPVYFDLSERHPRVAAWLKVLAADLGQRRSRMRVSIFASPEGGLTECHFDANENFTVQLRGRKRWRMAPNAMVTNPLERFTWSGVKTPISALYFDEAPPPELSLPEVADLVPGSMLYVPRGYWHQVEALEPSVSLNFCITPDTWISYLLPVIERRLVAEEGWREASSGVLGTPHARAQGRARARELLATLPAILSELTDQELVPDAYPSAGGLRLHSETALHRSRTAVLHWQMDTFGDRHRVHIQVVAANGLVGWHASAEAASVCSWIACQQELTLASLLRRFDGLPVDELRQLVYQLLAAGFLYTPRGSA